MERLLVVSPLDVTGSPNSRTHHLVRHLAPHFRASVMLARANGAHRSRRERWSALFRMHTAVRRETGITWVTVSPWGSVRPGLGLHLLGVSNPYAGAPGRLTEMVRRALSFLGLGLELGILPSLLAAYAVRVGGRVDVAVCQGPWEAVLGLVLRRLGRARTVIYDDMDFQPGFLPTAGLRRRLLEAVERFAIRRADLVVSVGERLALLRRDQGAAAHVVPNGVDVECFAQAERRRAAAGPRRPTAIYTGFLGAWAGIDLLLQASGQILHRLPDFRLILLGHGTSLDLQALRQGIRDLGLGAVVEFRGEVSYQSLPLHLAEADLGMAMFRPLDLTRYAFPLKVVEYMAAGLPVITTADTEAADLVGRAGAGEAVPYDPSAVAGSAVALLQDPVRRQALARAATAAARAFDWRDLMERERRLITGVVGRREGRPWVASSRAGAKP